MRYFLFRNFRLVFRIDYWVRRHFTLAGLLVIGGLVAAAIFGIDTRQTSAYQLFSVLCTLFIVSIVSNLHYKSVLKVARHLPTMVTVGESVTYHLTIKNPTKTWQRDISLFEDIAITPPDFYSFLHTRDPFASQRHAIDNYIGYPRWVWLMQLSKGAEILPQVLPDFAPYEQKSVKISLTPLRRGYIYFTHSSLARPDPLGLFRSFSTQAHPDKLLILPQRYQLPKSNLFGGRRYQQGGINLAQSVGDAEEITALRDYRVGDPLRLIHWKSWAKTGKPIVKELQEEFFIRHALVLDTFMADKYHPVFETAVSIAASFVAQPLSEESLLDLLFIGTESYHLTSGRGVDHTGHLLEVLACVSPQQSYDIAHLNTILLPQLTQLSGCICVLLAWDKARQDFVKQIQAIQTHSLIFVITDTDIKEELAAFSHVYSISTQNTAEELAAIFAKL